MLVTLLPIVTLVSLWQVPNEELPILVTLSGMVTVARFQHEANAESPILVTPFGIVTPVRPSRKLNAESPMRVTGRPSIVSGMATAPPGPVYAVIVIVSLLVV